MYHLCSSNIRFLSCLFLVHRIHLSDVYVKHKNGKSRRGISRITVNRTEGIIYKKLYID
jgi:hypothetical protein